MSSILLYEDPLAHTYVIVRARCSQKIIVSTKNGHANQIQDDRLCETLPQQKQTRKEIAQSSLERSDP
jgi:hypothetical protein